MGFGTAADVMLSLFNNTIGEIMAIPDFETIILPMLQLLSDDKEHHIRDVIDSLAKHFKLTEQERAQMQPSGYSRLFDNRAHWARKYVVEARLLDSPRRGIVVMTARGHELLSKKPDTVTYKMLEQYPEYLEFARGSRATSDQKTLEIPRQSVETPEEILESSHKQIHSLLASELLSLVKKQSAAFFEQLVVDLLVKMGYGGSRSESGQITKMSGDEGIDGTIHEDRLGLDVIYVQAKKWENIVGRPEIQKFVGALHGQRAKKGVFITTSSFSSEASEYVAKIDPKIVLIDGQKLAQYMIEYEVGISKQRSYEIKKIDSDYFESI